MTTLAKTKMNLKKSPKRTVNKNRRSYLPPSAGVVEIAGREIVFIPLDDFEEWHEDQLLGLLAKERMERHGDQTVSFEEICASLDRKKKGGK